MPLNRRSGAGVTPGCFARRPHLRYRHRHTSLTAHGHQPPRWQAAGDTLNRRETRRWRNRGEGKHIPALFSPSIPVLSPFLSVLHHTLPAHLPLAIPLLLDSLLSAPHTGASPDACQHDHHFCLAARGMALASRHLLPICLYATTCDTCGACRLYLCLTLTAACLA